MSLNLTPERARIFRITHVNNVPWIVRNGLWCPSSGNRDPGFITIGNADVIGKRSSRHVPLPPGGVLEDYVPFYFTPCSVMLFNIITGYTVPRRERDEIAILVSSLEKLQENDVQFVFTDRHALVAYAKFYDDVSALDRIDWALLRNLDFRRDDADPGKVERYQAEALAYRSVPTESLLGLACYAETTRDKVVSMLKEAGIDLPVAVKRDWFFG